MVLFHAFNALKYKFPSLPNAIPSDLIAMGYHGVQVFFVISGYCITQAAVSTKLGGKSIASYVTARLCRIYPPYWLTLLLFVLLHATGAFLVAQGKFSRTQGEYLNPLSQDWIFYVGNLFLIQHPLGTNYFNPVAWTLNYEVAFYALVGLALVLTRRLSVQAMISVLHALTLLCLVALIAGGAKNIPFPFDLWPQFGLGVLLYDLLSHRGSEVSQREPSGIEVLLRKSLFGLRHDASKVSGLTMLPRSKFWVIAIGLTLVLLISSEIQTSGWMESLAPKTLVMGYLVAMLFACLLYVLHAFDHVLIASRLGQIFAFLGVFSYSTYLVHQFPLTLFSTCIKILKVPDQVAWIVVVWLVMTFVVIAFSYSIYFFCEKPFIKKQNKSFWDMVS